MTRSAAQTDLVRLGGTAIWVSVGAFLPSCADPRASVAFTVVAYLGFGALFWGSSRKPLARTPVLLVLIAGQSALALLLTVMHRYFLLCGLFVIVGWQAALALPLVSALAWMAVDTALVGLALRPALPWPTLGSLLGTLGGLQIFAIACADLVRDERRARSELHQAISELRRAQAQLLSRERRDERLRIARDLHDELGHGLTALGLLAARAELTSPDEVTRARVAALRSEAGALLGRTREVVADLRDLDPPAGAIDVAAALEAFARGHDGPLEVTISTRGPLDAVSPPLAVAILRLVQEAATNAMRHAGPAATRLSIAVDATVDRIDVQARDDGAGAERVRLGHGLLGMRERVMALGGTLAVAARPGRGWSIDAHLPVQRS